MLPFLVPELNPRLELGMLLHPAGTYFYIPSKSPFEKGRLRGSRVHNRTQYIEKKNGSTCYRFPLQELNPRLELGMLSHPAGTYIYIPPKSSFGKGGLRGSRVHDQHIHIEKQKDSLDDYPFIFQS